MLVSLGHSCQTRFVIDHLDASGRRMPFDFNITTRQALIRAFETDGASLRHDEDAVSIFTMASDGRQGVEVGGMYFWHDYPLADDKLRLADGWRGEMPRINEKYAALWARFAALVRSEEEKTFLLSNSQHNLGEFAKSEEDFSLSFGLGRQASREISVTLDAFGARNYRLLFLSRSLSEFEETLDLCDPRLDHRFVGVLSLRPDLRVASSLAAENAHPNVGPLAGSYDGSRWMVKAISDRVAVLYGNGEDGWRARGSIAANAEGYVAFLEGRDKIFSIERTEDALRFPDGTLWMRD